MRRPRIAERATGTVSHAFSYLCLGKKLTLTAELGEGYRRPNRIRKMKYYYLIDGEQKGPASVEELINSGVKGDTLVWRQGMDDWKRASEVEELHDVIEQNTPPPPPVNSRSTMPPPRTKSETSQVASTDNESGHTASNATKNLQEPTNYMVYAILATILCCMPLGIVSVIYANKANTSWGAGKYSESIDATQKARLWLIIAVCVGAVSMMACAMLGFFSALFS